MLMHDFGFVIVADVAAAVDGTDTCLSKGPGPSGAGKL